MRDIVAGLIVLCGLGLAGGAQAQAQADAANDPCVSVGSSTFIETMGQYSQFHFAGIDSSVVSGTVGMRRCENPRFSWSLNATVDQARTEGRNATAARIGAGALVRTDDVSQAGGKAFWLLAGNVTAGVEDYHYWVGGTPTAPIFQKDQRSSTSAEAVVGYVLRWEAPRTTPGDPGPRSRLSQVYVEGRAAVFDKRAPSVGAPAYATETYEVLTGSVILTQFVDHERYGSRIDYTLQHQHLLSDTLLISDITTIGVRWRPQNHPTTSHAPDQYAIGLMAGFGDDDYRTVTLSLSKVF